MKGAGRGGNMRLKENMYRLGAKKRGDGWGCEGREEPGWHWQNADGIAVRKQVLFLEQKRGGGGGGGFRT